MASRKRLHKYLIGKLGAIMESIQLLTFLILVATLISFILSVGIYIIYKIRERKSSETLVQSVDVHAELVSPSPIITEREASRTVGGSTYTRVTTQVPIYELTFATDSNLRPTYVSQTPASSRYTVVTIEDEKDSSQNKFTRYMINTVAKSKSDEKNRENKESLRWR